MLLTNFSLGRPLFKDQLFFRYKDNEVVIFNRTQGCSISLESEYKVEILQLLRLLQIGARTPQELEQACPNIKENIPELLLNFKRRDLKVSRFTLFPKNDRWHNYQISINWLCPRILSHNSHVSQTLSPFHS